MALCFRIDHKEAESAVGVAKLDERAGKRPLSTSRGVGLVRRFNQTWGEWGNAMRDGMAGAKEFHAKLDCRPRG
jgi:hypothetical protein